MLRKNNPSTHIEPLISLHNVKAGYGPNAGVLHGVDLQIQPGIMTMILGRSGSGKTTLLRVIGGIIPTTEGTLQRHVFPLDHTHGKIAYIPQNLGLVRNVSALQNVLMGKLARISMWRALIGAFPRSSVDRARELLERLGLSAKIYTRVSKLSGGERQRVAIARALIQDPQLILADEFVSQLDVVTTQNIMRLTRDLVSSGISVVMTTHDPDLVELYADKIIVMHQGRILCNTASAQTAKAQLLGVAP